MKQGYRFGRTARGAFALVALVASFSIFSALSGGFAAHAQNAPEQGQGREPLVPEKAYVEFKFGDVDCVALTDGYSPSPSNRLAADVPEDELLAFLTERGQSVGIRHTPLACLVLRMDGDVILVDSGKGVLGYPTLGRLDEAMAIAGVNPEEITIVLVSHLHPDHIGGMFGENDEPCFPNAVYYATDVEV